MSSDTTLSPYRLSVAHGEVMTNLGNDTRSAVDKINAAAAVLANTLPDITDALDQIGTPTAAELRAKLQVAVESLAGQLAVREVPVI